MLSEKEGGIGSGFRGILVFALILVVSIGAIYAYSEVVNDSSERNASGGGEGYEKFVSENYGFSFSYPSNWIVENQKNPYTGSLTVIVRENVTENALQPEAWVQIGAGSLGITSIENAKSDLLSQVENNENLSKIKGPSDVTRGGLNGFDLTLRVNVEEGEFESRYLLLVGEKKGYLINSFLKGNSEEGFSDEIKRVFEEFTIL